MTYRWNNLHLKFMDNKGPESKEERKLWAYARTVARANGISIKEAGKTGWKYWKCGEDVAQIVAECGRNNQRELNDDQRQRIQDIENRMNQYKAQLTMMLDPVANDLLRAGYTLQDIIR